MDKNLLLAVSLSILVYAGWFGFVEKRAAKAPMEKPAPTAVEAGKPNPSEPGKASAPAVLAPAAPSKPAAPDSVESVVLDGAQAKIRARGAAVASWQYKGPRGLVELVAKSEPGLLSTFPDVAFKRAPGAGLVYVGARGPLKITKEFVPGGDGALSRLRLTIENTSGQPAPTGEWAITAGPGLGTIPTEMGENEKVTRVLGLTKGDGGLNGKIETLAHDAVPASFRWVGVDNRYFLAALLPAPGDFEKAAALAGHELALSAKSVTLAPRASKTWEVPYYLGAKGHTWLSRYKAGLERSIDFGFFAQLGRIVLKVLGKIHDVTGNWGWSIILLTIGLQTLLFPLTYKSLKATAAMRKLQPEIARLQQRYAKDPGKLNVEMMELYKKHGANPLGGCLPMLLQMPIFIALYNALRNAWELHGAVWAFWITDLSAKDPYYVLPVVMGALMFAQNKLNPMAGVDPAQQKMMTFMPIVFTVMFVNFPSGLVLYWLTNSLVSTLQQLALKEHFA